ncbi:RNA polymerase sigma factor [Kribbella capetownensis]|uniref:RNA polymerase sigma factor n=1 Tax=Kribbella capetownensis TaxID=1572659 RepID=A0A4R0JQZ3_9ACTN|nr:RNA polymerase sigma factor [Kribbella capetownensis]TCC49771.1 RNA polymerase sigma factor [Kribbella capetownensis]
MTSTPSPPRAVALRAVSDRELRFRELFENNYRHLLGYALRRVASPDDAADIVADTMLVAWRRFDEVPVDGTARLYLYGVARRVLANHRRGEIRRDRLAERLRLQLAEATPDQTSLADSTVAIREALAKLSDNDRELLMLTGWDGLDPREAAVVLGVPARTVRTRLHRARVRLRRVVGDAFTGDGHVRDDQHAPAVQEER